jgi:hypothetical protein
MLNNNKDLALQSYEKKIVTTLREEKYELPSLQKNKALLDHLAITGNSMTIIANKYYKEQINRLHESYINDFNALFMPLVLDKGLAFDIPEAELQEIIDKYEAKINPFIEKIQIQGRIAREPFFDAEAIKNNWSIGLDGVHTIPFLIALGSTRIIVLDESFNLDLHLFASLGGMPDIRPITNAGDITLPPETYSINLQILMNNEFKQVSIILFKQKLENIDSFLGFMENIVLIVDTKGNIDEDFTGLKWIKNSLQYSLFKKKAFIPLAKILKVGGLIIDKSVSPMQAQKISAMMKSAANLNIGYEINKLGTLQYSILQKKENEPLTFDAFNGVICRIPDVKLGGGKFSTM